MFPFAFECPLDNVSLSIPTVCLQVSRGGVCPSQTWIICRNAILLLFHGSAEVLPTKPKNSVLLKFHQPSSCQVSPGMYELPKHSLSFSFFFSPDGSLTSCCSFWTWWFALLLALGWLSTPGVCLLREYTKLFHKRGGKKRYLSQPCARRSSL